MIHLFVDLVDMYVNFYWIVKIAINLMYYALFLK